MATPNVTINVNTPTVRAKELEREAEEAKKKRDQKVATIPDEYESVSTKTLAVAGEPANPPQRDKSRHALIKEAQSNLTKAFTAAGGKDGKSIAEKPEETATKLIKKLEGELAVLREKGDPEQIDLKQKSLEDLKSALQAHQALLVGDQSTETLAVQSKGETEGSQAETSSQEKKLWADVEKVAKSIGFDVAKGSDIEQVRQEFTERMRGKVVELQSKVNELNSRKKELEAKLKTATPVEKIALEKLLKEVAAQLTQVNQKILQYQKAFNDFNTHADAFLAFQATKDLGLPTTPVVRSASVKTEKTEKKSSGGGAPKSGGGTPVQTQSVTGGTAGSGKSTFVLQGDVEKGTEGPLMGTASAEDAGDGLATSPLAQTMASDFSGTTLAIASAGSNAKSEARKTDKILKKLLRAALAGNFEAIKTALIFLDKRASLVTVGMGAQTIKAMQNYEKQMSVLSSNIGKLKGTEPDYNAKLAKINSEMNQYSMNRQAIANFLRDTMSMKEEISNLTSSFLTKAGQISSTVSRWG